MVLITGGTGLLGKGMEETAPLETKIVSVHLRDYKVPKCNSIHITLDMRDKCSVEQLFQHYHFDSVVHAAGISDVDYVETHYKKGFESNINSTLNIIAACEQRGIHLIYVSTNAVFDGTKPPYFHTDSVNPVNKYGKLKVECERLIQEKLEKWTIVRPILMYGWNHMITRPNTVTWIYEKLCKGEIVELVDDVYENPLYNHQCGNAIWAIIKKQSFGIFHLAGHDTVNRWQFGINIATAFGLNHSLIKRVNSLHFPNIAERPKNTTFSINQMENELGVRALTLIEGLTMMGKKLNS